MEAWNLKAQSSWTVKKVADELVIRKTVKVRKVSKIKFFASVGFLIVLLLIALFVVSDLADVSLLEKFSSAIGIFFLLEIFWSLFKGENGEEEVDLCIVNRDASVELLTNEKKTTRGEISSIYFALSKNFDPEFPSYDVVLNLEEGKKVQLDSASDYVELLNICNRIAFFCDRSVFVGGYF